MNKHLSEEIRHRARATGYSWEKIAQTKVELIALHELGHLYHFSSGIGSPSKWFRELVAGYFPPFTSITKLPKWLKYGILWHIQF